MPVSVKKPHVDVGLRDMVEWWIWQSWVIGWT